MKELSTEQKAKAYDEALERAKKLQETCDSTTVVGWCEYIFPELKESEDERIRKAIKSGIKHLETKLGYDAVDGVDILDIYSWIEKQDHMLDAAKVIEWLKRCNITDCDMRTSIIPDSSPTSNPHRVRWFSEDFIDKFKKDFGLC